MKEYNILDEKKKLAQFITPIPLREFIKKEAGVCNVVFDCSVGSGQLIYELEASRKVGTDIDENAVIVAVQNGIDAIVCDYITSDFDCLYDTAISNYPFSLKATSEQAECLEKDGFFKMFLNKQGKFTGVLDFVFILKSFLKAQRGFYLCFPGIAYRGAEKKYREYLVKNKYVEKIALITNAGFEDTKIPILYLKLSKKENTEVLISEIDIVENSITEKTVSYSEIIKNDYNFSTSCYIEKKIEKEKIDILLVESETTKNFESFVKNSLELDYFLLTNNMLSRDTFFDKIKILEKYLEKYKNS